MQISSQKSKTEKKNPVCLTVGLVAQSCFLMRVSLEECIKCSSWCLNSGFFLIPFWCQEHLFSLSASICYYGKRMAGNGWWQLIIETEAQKKGTSQARAKKRRTSLRSSICKSLQWGSTHTLSPFSFSPDTQSSASDRSIRVHNWNHQNH